MLSGKNTNYAIEFYRVDERGLPLKLILKKANFPVIDRPWYLAAVNAGKHTWSSTFTYHAYPEMAVPTSMPLAKGKKIEGVVGNNIFLTSLSSFLKSLEISHETRLYIIDDKHHLIASNHIERPFLTFNGTTQKIHLQDVNDITTQQINGQLSSITFREKQFYQIPINYNEYDEYAYVYQLQDQDSPPWKIVVFHPSTEILHLLYKQLQTFTVIHIAVIALIILFSFALTRAITRPIVKITQTAEKITSGDYCQSINHRSSDELGRLSIAFNSMTQKLLKNMKALREESEQVKLKEHELEVKNEELTQFNYRASHDIGSPISTSLGLINLTEEDLADGNFEEVRINLTKIKSSLKRLNQLVLDILDLTKADLVDDIPEHIPVLPMIEEIIAQVKMNHPHSSCDISFQSEDIDSKIICSKVRLQQILINLIDNSVKYSDPKKTSQHVTIRFTTHLNDYHLCIEDNGLGIDQAYRDRVFKMFERFHPHISQGSGLGLSIVKKYVDKMKGTISFSSSKEGSKFEISLPVLSLINYSSGDLYGVFHDH